MRLQTRMAFLPRYADEARDLEEESLFVVVTVNRDGGGWENNG